MFAVPRTGSPQGAEPGNEQRETETETYRDRQID